MTLLFCPQEITNIKFITKYMDNKTFIDKEKDLNKVLQEHEKDILIGLDCEFMRHKTFYPQLCLIQISFADEICICIDALKLPLNSLWDYLYEENRILIVHAGRQDIEILFHATHKIPKNIFDTQLAFATYQGVQQVSYQQIVQDFLNVYLAKKYTLADWTKRPLSADKIQYAVEDVQYLIPIYHTLYKHLKNEKKITIYQELLTTLTTNIVDSFKLSYYVKTLKSSRITDKEKPMFHAIGIWREKMARYYNVPRRWVLDNRTMLSLITSHQDDADILKEHAIIKKEDIQQLFNDIKVAKSSVIEKEQKEPDATNQKHPTSPNKRNINQLALLKGFLIIKAQIHHIDSKLLATTDDLIEFIQNSDDPKFSEDWRYDFFWKEALSLIQGKLSISYNVQTQTIFISSL